MNELNVVDLFCGCGGLSYGFEQAGFNVILGIDNDASALKTFRSNHKDTRTICADISTLNEADIIGALEGQKVDIVVGGPPCQGMSLSGPRKIDDPRNKLYLSFIRVVEILNPVAIVIENVPGIVSLYKGKIKDNIIKSLSSLGYNVSFKILDASNYGVPQARKRVFFIGLKNGCYNFENELCKFEQQTVSTEMALSDLPSLEDDYGVDEANYLNEPTNHYQRRMRRSSTKLYNHVAAKHAQHIIDTIAMVPAGGNYKDLPDSFKSTRKFNVAWTRFPKDLPSPTIDTGHRHHFHYEYNRVPTVRECARLQSFPDVFRFFGNKTQQFRQVGNAVPPILAEAIAISLANRLK